MSFNGDLEHFPLVDVIQLLHMTGKSGVLNLKNSDAESQLVFREGFLVGANHMDNRIRIGKVLVDMSAITHEQLSQALSDQKGAGEPHKPLVATLIEQGTINKETAFKGLETLIEMTIVEVLSWATGEFSLDVAKEFISDEYRYFPETLNQKILLNAQAVLMDSLRIYDEKVHDGTLGSIFFTEETDPTVPPQEISGPEDITADLLGLAELDTVAAKIPDVFIGLKDLNSADEHRQIVASELPEAANELREQLISLLSTISDHAPADHTPPNTAIILLTQNKLVSHAITAVCRRENLFVFTSDEESGLDMVIEQSLGRDLHPVLIIDVPHGCDEAHFLTLVRQKMSAYPQISIVLAACEHVWRSISMEALGARVRSIIPHPCERCHNDEYTAKLITFISGVGAYLKSIHPVPSPDVDHHFNLAFNQLQTLSKPPEIALVLLQFIALQFERALTFVVSKTELIAEKSIGISSPKADGPTAPLMFKIPLEKNSVLQEVVEKGRLYYGQRNDTVLTNRLYSEIGAPRSPKVLAVPLISRGKVIAVTYADFGSKPVSPPHLNLLTALAGYAGSIIDNSVYRKSIETPAR